MLERNPRSFPSWACVHDIAYTHAAHSMAHLYEVYFLNAILDCSFHSLRTILLLVYHAVFESISFFNQYFSYHSWRTVLLLVYHAVFVGISWSEYHSLCKAHGVLTGPYEAQGAVLSVAPGRISFTFGLQVHWTRLFYVWFNVCCQVRVLGRFESRWVCRHADSGLAPLRRNACKYVVCPLPFCASIGQP